MHNLKHFEMVDSSKFAPFPDPSENPFNISMSNEFADASNGLEIHKEPFIQSTQVFSNPKAISSQRTNLDMSDEQSRRGSVQPFQSMPTTCPSTPMKQNKSKRVSYLSKVYADLSSFSPHDTCSDSTAQAQGINEYDQP